MQTTMEAGAAANSDQPDPRLAPRPDLEGEIGRLKEEHRDLDDAIEALRTGIAGDQLQLQRLKKRKLVLRDRIAHLEDQLHPDIIA